MLGISDQQVLGVHQTADRLEVNSDQLSSDDEPPISNIPAPGAKRELIQKYLKEKTAELRKVQQKQQDEAQQKHEKYLESRRRRHQEEFNNWSTRKDSAEAELSSATG